MRAIGKTISYSTMHFTVAITVAYALTGDWQIALGVGIVEPMVQTIAYVLHERLWSPRRSDPATEAAPRAPCGAPAC